MPPLRPDRIEPEEPPGVEPIPDTPQPDAPPEIAPPAPDTDQPGGTPEEYPAPQQRAAVRPGPFNAIARSAA